MPMRPDLFFDAELDRFLTAEDGVPWAERDAGTGRFFIHASGAPLFLRREEI